MPMARITTKGLKWNLLEQTLSFPGVNSCFNRTLEDRFSVFVHEGALLAMIYLEPMNDAGVD